MMRQISLTGAHDVSAKTGILACCLLPFLVIRENAMVLVSTNGAGADSSSLGSVGPRWILRIGIGTSKWFLRSNLRESRLSDIIFSNARSKSASTSGSSSSSGRVTTICSSSSESISGSSSPRSSSAPAYITSVFCKAFQPILPTSPSSSEDWSASISASPSPRASSDAESSMSSGCPRDLPAASCL